MGGGGGGGYFSSGKSAEELAKGARDAEKNAMNEAFEIEVADFLGEQLADFNDRDVEGIRKTLEDIKNAIEDEIEGTIDTMFGGSVAKHTYVDGLSDIDTLLILNNSELANSSPNEVKDTLSRILSERYGADSVYKGQLAVTVKRDGKEIQILPALRDKKGLKIADSTGNGWSKINPQKFIEKLISSNKELSGKLVPSIKLIKGILSNLPDQRKLTGYHVESLAIEVFKNYTGAKTTKDMLRHFFEKSSEFIRQPIKDSTGQSVHTDAYLGEANSLQRRIVADALSRIGRRVKNADGAQSIDRWRGLFDE